MANKIRKIELEKLIAHPANPNRMSEGTFAKLIRNIERTGRYEPIVVRPHPLRKNHFQIINGHHRCKALEKLGHTEADCVVWNVDDEQTNILLATLNRLCGSDVLGKKLGLLKQLNKRMGARELARLLPPTAKQIERLMTLKMPSMPVEESGFSSPMIFFVNDAQGEVIEKALSSAQGAGEEKTKAARRAAGLARISREYIERLTEESTKQ
jgi:hypothetical protein